jgi:hypothetical protein
MSWVIGECGREEYVSKACTGTLVYETVTNPDEARKFDSYDAAVAAMLELGLDETKWGVDPYPKV